MSNDILSPEEWLKERRIYNEPADALPRLLDEYADHVARRVARNVRHRACGVVNRYSPEIAGQREKMVINCMLTDIMQIQLRDVYPEGKEKEDPKVEITFSDEIVSCGDGCCHSEGWHIVNQKGEYGVFITDMNEKAIKELITHLVSADVSIVVNHY